MFERKTRKRSPKKSLRKTNKKSSKRSPKKVVRQNKSIRKLGGDSVTSINQNTVNEYRQIVFKLQENDEITEKEASLEALFYKIVLAFAMNVPKDPTLEFVKTYEKYYQNDKHIMIRLDDMKKRFEEYSKNYVISEGLKNDFLEVSKRLTSNDEFTETEKDFYKIIINLAKLFQQKTNDEFKKRYKIYFPEDKDFLGKMQKRFEKYLELNPRL